MRKKFLTVAVMTAVAMMTMTGCGDDKKTTEISTEITTETEPEVASRGYSSSEDAIKAFFKGYESVDKDMIASCFYEKAETAVDVETNYATAQAVSSYTVYHLDEMTFELEGDANEEAKKLGYNAFDATEMYTVTVPMTQTLEDAVYEVNDIYTVSTVNIDGIWYICKLDETDVQIVGDDTATTATETDTTAHSSAPSLEGFSDVYADLDNRSFAIDGHVYVIGVSTLQDMIDDGITFDGDDIANANNNINPNYESQGFKIDLGEWNSCQVYVGNWTDENKTMAECPLSEIYFPVDLEKEGNDRIQFAFPLTVTEEELLANSGDPTEDMYEYVSDDGSYVSHKYEYKVDSEKYYGSSGYEFEFVNGTLKYLYITFK